MYDCFLSLSCLLNLALAVALGLGWRTVRQRLTVVEGRLTFLEIARGAPEYAPSTVIPPLAEPVTGATAPQSSQTSAAANTTGAAPVSVDSGPSDPMPALVWLEEPVGPLTPPAPQPWHPLLAWFINMHLMVQVGVVLLFFGVGFLVKYAADQGWFPLEVRLASAAALGAALAAVGWRLRHQRRTYGLALIGGGIGIVYLTTFGAYWFYGLLPAPLAFAIFVTLSLLYALMALFNDAPILAFLALVGAFLAPILASDGGGNHIVLFSYYAVVNLGVLAIARYKQWSRLNVVSFSFSALAAAGWAATAYQPAYFTSTALFLGLFFAFYLLISLWQTQLPPASQVNGMSVGDLILLFANPIVSFLLAAGLLQDHAGWLAYCALLLTGIYGAISLWLRRNEGAVARLVGDSSFFFAAFFLTIAVPLRFDSRVTAAIWSVMGVGLVWLSLRRGQRLLRDWGVLVHLLAMGAFTVQLSDLTDYMALRPYLNHLYLGALMVSVTVLMSGALIHRSRQDDRGGAGAAPLATLLLVLGLLWWYGGGLAQFPLYAARTDHLALLLLYLSASGFLAEAAGRWLRWPALRWPALSVLPSAALVTVILLVQQQHPFTVGWYAWPAALAVHLLLLYGWQGRRGMAIFHAGWVWLVTLLASWWAYDWVIDAEMATSWQILALIGPALVVIALVGPLVRRLPWPVAGNQRSYVGAAGAPIAAWLFLITALAALFSDGASAPLPFWPFLNPLDVTLGVTVLLLWQWSRALQRLLPATVSDTLQTVAGWLIAALALLVINGAVARAVAYLTDLPYTWPALYGSALLQMIYALLWGALALTLMLIAHHRRLHQLWLIGAAILALTVGKLFLVDLAQSGTLTRIVSFLGVGLLTITIAYFWPAPPRRDLAAEESIA
jgi:uncharacterized membrane protein